MFECFAEVQPVLFKCKNNSDHLLKKQIDMKILVSDEIEKVCPSFVGAHVEVSVRNTPYSEGLWNEINRLEQQFQATLTTEIANNGTDSNSALFTATAFQNGQETGGGFIETDGQIQSGYTATVTTEFDIKDATQPVSLEIGMYSQTLRAEFDPQN